MNFERDQADYRSTIMPNLPHNGNLPQGYYLEQPRWVRFICRLLRPLCPWPKHTCLHYPPCAVWPRWTNRHMKIKKYDWWDDGEHLLPRSGMRTQTPIRGKENPDWSGTGRKPE